MAYLGDFLGQLVTEVTRARMQADLEAVRVAELYASHHLLRHMPVPHFRLPDVELEVPVVLQDLDGDPSDAQSHPSAGAVTKAFQGALSSALKEHGVTMSAAQKKSVLAAVEKRLPALMGPAEVSADMLAVADGAARAAVTAMSGARGPLQREKIAAVEKSLRDAARSGFLKLRGTPPRLRASVKTMDVKEAGAGEVVTRFRLKITEEAVEWTSIDDDGETPNRLVIS